MLPAPDAPGWAFAAAAAGGARARAARTADPGLACGIVRSSVLPRRTAYRASSTLVERTQPTLPSSSVTFHQTPSLVPVG